MYSVCELRACRVGHDRPAPLLAGKYPWGFSAQTISGVSPQRAPIAYRRRPWLGEDALVLDYELEPQPRTIVVWTACKTEISPEPGKLSLAAFSVAQRSVGGSAFLHGICLIPLADHSMLF